MAGPGWTPEDIVTAKGDRTVSVVLPALDEERTVGASSPGAAAGGIVVDELVVMDSGSTGRHRGDRRRRRCAGRVPRGRPAARAVPGKGEVLWRSLAATSGALVVFPRLRPRRARTRRSCRRCSGRWWPRRACTWSRASTAVRCGSGEGTGGGRVTELLARPLLAALRPSLGGLVQPLGGEYAGTREFLESVPFAAGYGVEIGLLLDAEARYGLGGLAQVNLGVRKHRNRSLLQLGAMSRQILGTALSRCGVPSSDAPLTQFVQVDEEWLPDVTTVRVADRPPMREVLARPRG